MYVCLSDETCQAGTADERSGRYCLYFSGSSMHNACVKYLRVLFALIHLDLPHFSVINKSRYRKTLFSGYQLRVQS